jgi:hypothetical protein
MSKLHTNREYFTAVDKTVEKVRDEINNGLVLLNDIEKPIITFFGSHRVTPKSTYYQSAKQLAYELGENGYAILSGGGPGVMHAANLGATKAGAPSIGLKAELLKGERIVDPILTHELSFHFLFARRFIMSIKSEALIFFPGGYGTLNELFEYAVLMQTDIVDTVPIICVNKAYWRGLFDWLKANPLRKDFFIHNNKDLGLLHFVDSFSEIMNLLFDKY